MQLATGPAVKRYRSIQDVGTPDDFLDAVQRRFGRINFDLAASADNAVCPDFYGPGSSLHEDSLAGDCVWNPVRLNWLNPPFSDIKPWARKCAESDAPVLLLVPASIGSDWFRLHVQPFSYVLALSPRLKFKGHEQPFPKDLILCCFGFYGFKGFDTWRWK